MVWSSLVIGPQAPHLLIWSAPVAPWTLISQQRRPASPPRVTFPGIHCFTPPLPLGCAGAGQKGDAEKRVGVDF